MNWIAKIIERLENLFVVSISTVHWTVFFHTMINQRQGSKKSREIYKIYKAGVETVK